MDGLGFFYPIYHLQLSRAYLHTSNLFESSSPKMLDHLEARMGRNHTKNHFILQALSLSPLTLFSIHFWHKWEIFKTTFGLISHIKCKAMFGLHTISISHFSHLLVFISLIIYFTLTFKLSFDP